MQASRHMQTSSVYELALWHNCVEESAANPVQPYAKLHASF